MVFYNNAQMVHINGIKFINKAKSSLTTVYRMLCMKLINKMYLFNFSGSIYMNHFLL